MNVGDVVRFKEEYSNKPWYHKNTMVIIGVFNYSFNNEMLYETDYKFDESNKHFTEKYFYNVLDSRKKKLDSL
ncbi:hypothetical protein M0Q50_03760 [bacterium]|jgi:N-acetylneuraminic acid mutarotase|nr:hypothetical protein [bacterium]